MKATLFMLIALSFIPEPYKCVKKNLILYISETDLRELDSLWTQMKPVC